MMSKVVKMQDRKTIPTGYKQTEVGIIPEDWGVDSIGHLLSITTGKKNTQDKVDDGTYPFFVRSQTIEKINSYSFDGEGVLTAGDGVGTGKIFHYLKGKFDFHQRVYLMYNFKETLDGYFFYIIFSNYFYDRIMSMTAKSSVDSVRREMIADMKITLPPKNEQTAIALVISDTDALINALERLLEKKQAIKTATMQQLLTGRIRLTQFAKHPDGTIKGYKFSDLGHIPEDWEEREIGQFAPLQRGFDLPASKRSEGLYPVVYSNGIVNTHNHFQVKGPGVVTGRSGTLGKVHHIECDFWPHNTSLWVTKFIKSDSKFVYYIFKYIGFERFASGSGVPTLNRNDAHSFKVAIPSSLKEQTAIATVLSDMDAELVTLEKKLAKVRDIKQGMMQQLLTGRIRLSLDHQP
ncbi:restriction endonuclease subunit S [Paramixta manurensis]|uniref:Restriction endonuclease subunit S n=1 Tax=Paramixta manurensis TaxID=2740817 RepID=A0A6M8U7I2_9GAMM|nr:restriction endonuclease subunit S [Erwiniaceae bacterium PD-1]